MADIGRKAWITLYGMTVVTIVGMVGLLTEHRVPDGMFNAIMTLVSVFCVGNAAISMGTTWTGNSTTTDTTTRTIAEKRNGDTETTP